MSYATQPWPSELQTPTDPMDNVLRYRAQSILSGSLLGGTACPPLTTEQAADVLRWAEQRAA